MLWSYCVQLASGLRAIHASGRACRTLDLSKVGIIVSRLVAQCSVTLHVAQVLLLDRTTNRVKINGVGLRDVVQYDVGKRSLDDLQVCTAAELFVLFDPDHEWLRSMKISLHWEICCCD